LINTIIFDLGGVLIDWQPMNVYIKAFNGDEEKAKLFLENVCTMAWNVEQDAGRPISEAVRIKTAEFPQYEELVKKYYDEWPDMLNGVMEDTLAILEQLIKNEKYKVYALTNWSAETFPIAKARYDFLNWFDGIVVSGEVKMRKPFPEIYHHTLKTFNIKAEQSIFIDDNLDNINTANEIGITAIHFKNAAQLNKDLMNLKIEI